MRKNIFLLLITFIVLFVAACGNNNDETENSTNKKGGRTNFDKRYAIKYGIIQYNLSGSQKGTKTLYFDNWGLKQAEYTNSEISVAGFSKKTNLLNLIDGDYSYTIDLDKNTGTKIKNPILKELRELEEQQSFNEFGEQLLLKSGAVKTGEESFLNRDCDVYEIKAAGTKLWVWNWITLKSESKLGGVTINSNATSVNENSQIPADKFSIPENVVLTEVDLENIEEQLREEFK